MVKFIFASSGQSVKLFIEYYRSMTTEMKSLNTSRVLTQLQFQPNL